MDERVRGGKSLTGVSGGQLTYGEVKDSFIFDRKIIFITMGVKCSVVTHSVSGHLPTVEALVNFQQLSSQQLSSQPTL